MCDLVKRIVKANEDLKKIKTAQNIGESNVFVQEVYKNENAFSVSGSYLSKNLYIIFETDKPVFPLIQVEGNLYFNNSPMARQTDPGSGYNAYYLTVDESILDDSLLKKVGIDLSSGRYAFAKIGFSTGSTSGTVRLNLRVKSICGGLVYIKDSSELR